MESKDVKQKHNANMRLVGINLLVLVIYTVGSALIADGLILDAFLIFLHVLTCIIASITFKKWSWLLSAALVLVVGFSTCVEIAKLR